MEGKAMGKTRIPWQLIGGTPLGLFVLAMIAIIARDVWHPSLPNEILLLFLLLLLALGLTHERLMFRINLLGEGLHIHLDEAEHAEAERKDD
ncbi:MAG: hypothetical protein WCF22_14240 [Candidatus Sulfotelmatobacter sp.]